MIRHVLVTGGAGFIGSHLVDAYVESGWRVTVVDDLSTGMRENLHPAARFIEGDIRRREVLDAAFSDPVDLVNHQAAQVDVRFSVADPAADAERNIIASLLLFEAARQREVEKIIFASSGGAIYGEPLFAPQSEEHACKPLSPYGCAKLSIEHYLNYYTTSCGMRAVALRYGNVYGPRQRADGEAGVVAIFGGRMLRREPVVINGSGEQSRDYVYIDDVVAANLAVSAADISGSFNVGTGIETSVSALYEQMRTIVSERFGIAVAAAEHGEAKRGEQMRSVLDGSALRARLSLPDPVPLDEGLAGTLEWLARQ